jgi:aquaporin Z
MVAALRRHWPEYAIEAGGLALFMLVASAFAALLEHPGSPLRAAVDAPVARRALMGLAMGLTAVALIYSPWGTRSGAHLNPAVTLTFFRLGRVGPWDALAYGLAQCVGGVAGVLVARTALGPALAHPSVNYIVTVPGPAGASVAFAAEAAITFVLMSVVLVVSSDARRARFTGLCAGALVALWITLEAPLSGMSMNPARTLGPAVVAGEWTAFWVYVAAPPLGMLVAAEAHARLARRTVPCAKLHHDDVQRCIFRCERAGAAGAAVPRV